MTRTPLTPAFAAALMLAALALTAPACGGEGAQQVADSAGVGAGDASLGDDAPSAPDSASGSASDVGATPHPDDTQPDDTHPDHAPPDDTHPDDDALPIDVAAPQCPPQPDPGPVAGDAIDACEAKPSDVVQLSPEADFNTLAVSAQGAGNFGVAGARYGADGEVRFWHVLAFEVVAEDIWPAAVDAGPWIVAIGDDSYAVIWGEGYSVRFARPGGVPVTTSTSLAPAGAFARQGGTRVLARGTEAWELIGTDDDGTWQDGHAVTGNAKVDRIWLMVEGDLVVIPFTGPGDEQPLSYLTGDVQGGQCSLPAPYYLDLGPDAEMLAIGAAYGLTSFAWRTLPPTGCPTRSRIHVRLFSFDGVEFESAVPFGDQVRWTASASVGTATTLVADQTGWRMKGQAVDLPAKQPGQIVTGPLVPDQPIPSTWEVTRDRGHHILTWQAPQGVLLQRFCF